MAGLDGSTTTERNFQPDAESRRHVQGTTLGIKRSFPEYQAGDLETLRSARKVLRGAVTSLLKTATELRQAPSPSPSDLLGAINELVRKDAELNGLNDTIGEKLEGDEFEIDYCDALRYQERICGAISRLRSTLNDLKAPGFRRHSTSGRAEPPHHTEDQAEQKDMLAGGSNEVSSSLRNDKLVAGNGTDISSTVERDETQTASVDLKVARAPEETHIEPPPCQVEYIFVPDFMKGESLPQHRKTLAAPIVELAHEIEPMHEAESFHLCDVGKPGRDRTEPCELTPITKTKASESDTTSTQTRRKPKTDQRRSSFNSEDKNYRKAFNPSSVPRDCFRYPLTTDAGRTVWFRRTSRWRRMALLKWQRRLKHRWRRKK